MRATTVKRAHAEYVEWNSFEFVFVWFREEMEKRKVNSGYAKL